MLNQPISSSSSTHSFTDWMQFSQDHIETALAKYLPPPTTVLHEAMRYAVLNGGKRVRALLVFAAGQLFDADHAELTRAACAIEMMHAYSLVHDDMPCMDNDALRRGKPTVHIKFDETTALLVGDALQAQAFSTLAQGKIAPIHQLEMLQILAHAAGSHGMCGGQALDLEYIGCVLSREQLEHMHQLKTGALLRASVLLGALCASSHTNHHDLTDLHRSALDRYSSAIGLAFQVVDDILDVTANSAALGKTSGKDAANNKPTYVSTLGLDASQLLAEDLRIEAHQALQSFDATQSKQLAQLADFIVQRIA